MTQATLSVPAAIATGGARFGSTNRTPDRPGHCLPIRSCEACQARAEATMLQPGSGLERGQERRPVGAAI
ncbi:MAG: hypothetical protein V3S20_02775 [Dehalococcoidia bacterium]